MQATNTDLEWRREESSAWEFWIPLQLNCRMEPRLLCGGVEEEGGGGVGEEGGGGVGKEGGEEEGVGGREMGGRRGGGEEGAGVGKEG